MAETQPQADIALSVVVPIYNDAHRIEANVSRMVSALRANGDTFELILMDDGSHDHTAQVIHTLANRFSEVSAYHYPVNRGKGYAVRQGILKAKGRYVFFTDADLPYGTDPILEGVAVMQATQADYVCGTRDTTALPQVPYPPLRKLTKRLFSALVQCLFRLETTDTQCGLKGFRGDIAHAVFKPLVIEDFAFDVEVLLRARQQGYRLALLPVTLSHSPSSFSVLPASIRMVGSLIRLTVLMNQHRHGL